MAKITIKSLEDHIFELEQIKIVIRAEKDTEVDEYDFKRCAANSSTVSDWIENRLKPSIGDLEFSIISGDYTHPHGRTKLRTLRGGYER